MTQLIVVVSDDAELRRFLGELLQSWTAHTTSVELGSFESRFAGQMQRWLEQASCILLSRDRHYPQGDCAEGIDVGESMLNCGKRVLVIGSGCHSAGVRATHYWDWSDKRPLLVALNDALEGPTPSAAERRRLLDFFADRRGKPIGHDYR